MKSMTKSQAASALGKMAKGKPKTITTALIAQRKNASMEAAKKRRTQAMEIERLKKVIRESRDPIQELVRVAILAIKEVDDRHNNLSDELYDGAKKALKAWDEFSRKEIK